MRYESRIEIWKSKPAWLVKLVSERKRLFTAFAQVVQTHAWEGTPSEGVPCLIEKGDASLLIWVTPSRGLGIALKAMTDIAEYFEPMLFVTPNGHLTLKALVEKFSG